MPDPGDLIPFRGAIVDRRTAAALTVAERKLGYELSVVKGHDVASADSVSSTTHNGRGVVDLAPFDWQRKLRVLKEVGFAIWHRLPSEGPWSEHEHGALIGVGHGLDPSAQRQVDSFKAGRNGLANDAPDRNPWRPSPAPQPFSYAAWWREQQDESRDDILKARVKGWKATRKKLADRISAMRARRRRLGKRIEAARSEIAD